MYYTSDGSVSHIDCGIGLKSNSDSFYVDKGQIVKG